MHATIPKSASATWRAIVAGRSALKTSLISRVGDGSTISVWEDKWVPSTVTMLPISKPANTHVHMVSDLIDSANWTWNRELMRDTFIAPDAEAILNIPIRRGGGEDFLASAYETSGTYSAKSAYRALVNQKECIALDEGTATNTSQTDEHMWTMLWKLKVLPKVRVFWWRVVRGILPDESMLKHWHIRPISRCNVCLAMDEDLMHALVHCSHAKLFWEQAHALLGVRRPRPHPDTWSRDIICDTQFTDIERAQMISIMWAIWHSRNRITHDGEQLDPLITVRRIREDLAVLDIPSTHASVLPGHGWRPPVVGFVKINTDAALSMDSDKVGACGVARTLSALLGAWSKPHVGVTDPFIGETLAIRDGVIFASLRGFSHVIMETDCLEVVINFQKKAKCSYSMILREVEDTAKLFTLVEVVHEYREFVVDAHRLAMAASSLGAGRYIWLGSLPDICNIPLNVSIE